MPVQIKRSGTKLTVKITGTLTTLMSSIRYHQIQPEKGNKNPPHIHVKVPPALNKKTMNKK